MNTNTRKIRVGDNVTYEGKSWAVTRMPLTSQKFVRLCIPGDPSTITFAPIDKLILVGPWR